jgi:Tfp pilus assembly protein PilF
VLRLDPHNARAWYQKGTTLQKMGRNEEALASFERALAQNPDNIIVLFNKGMVLITMGRNADAIQAFDAALAVQEVPEIRKIRDALANTE